VGGAPVSTPKLVVRVPLPATPPTICALAALMIALPTMSSAELPGELTASEQPLRLTLVVPLTSTSTLAPAFSASTQAGAPNWIVDTARPRSVRAVLRNRAEKDRFCGCSMMTSTAWMLPLNRPLIGGLLTVTTTPFVPST
jgi:hypothetical protein